MFVSSRIPSPKTTLVQGSHAHIPRGPSAVCQPLPVQELWLLSPGQWGRSQSLVWVTVQAKPQDRVLCWVLLPQLPLQGDQGPHSSGGSSSVSRQGAGGE